VKIEGEWTLCEDGSRFLLKHEDDIVIFCSDNGIVVLVEARR
jgi:hypothetical protein